MTDRIQTLDMLRGIAILGLPLMNMVAFAMPTAAYFNPTVFDGSSALNHFIYSLFNIFANQKFMGLFSLLFGAGIILLAERRKALGKGTVSGHYSRMFWLFIFGAFHFWFLWAGDILTLYAVIACLVFPMYKSSTKFLFIITIIALSLSVFLSSNSYVTSVALGPAGKAEILQEFDPTQEYLSKLKQQKLSPSYNTNMLEYRSLFLQEFEEDIAVDVQENPANDQLALSNILKVFGLMTLGMLLYRTGFLTGKRSHTEYQLMAQFGLIIGMSFTLAGLFWNYNNNWEPQAFFKYGIMLSSIGSIAMTIAYVALIVLAKQKDFFGKFAPLIENVGRMALTNYLMQSFICIFIFYGFAFGLYGSLTRLGLIPIIIVMCALQIYFSKYWLSLFVQGPFEWLLRTLSNFRIQTLRKQVAD
jgi:uncharacterized protein